MKKRKSPKRISKLERELRELSPVFGEQDNTRDRFVYISKKRREARYESVPACHTG
ncbi:MAG: hypothetical protein IH901_03510 [Proteobacteria bacterium]|nr:hypothetical protein [Pseudomonadota bacterium]